MKRCPTCNRVEADDALGFCRLDGTPLIGDSLPLGSEAGTAQLGSASLANEIETSILPHATDAGINQPTAPTTLLPAQAAPSATGNLAKTAYQRKLLIAFASLIIVTVAAIGYLYVSRRNSTTIDSIAVMPYICGRKRVIVVLALRLVRSRPLRLRSFAGSEGRYSGGSFRFAFDTQRTHHLPTTINDLYVDILLHRYYVASVF